MATRICRLSGLAIKGSRDLGWLQCLGCNGYTSLPPEKGLPSPLSPVVYIFPFWLWGLGKAAESLRCSLGECRQTHTHPMLPSTRILSLFLLCLLTEEFWWILWMAEVMFAGVESERWNRKWTGQNCSFTFTSGMHLEVLVTGSQFHHLQWWVRILTSEGCWMDEMIWNKMK